MVVEEKARAHILMRYVELDTNHQSASANINDMLFRLLQFLKLVEKIITHLTSVLHEILLLHNVDNSQGSSASQMIATEGGAQLSVFGFEVGRDEYGAHRESVAYTLGACDDVGTDVEPLMGKELTATAISALYLVAYQYGSVFLAESLQSLCKLGSGKSDAANTLNTFDDTSTYIALCQFLLPCLDVVEREIGGVAIGIDRGDNLRIVGHLHCQ